MRVTCHEADNLESIIEWIILYSTHGSFNRNYIITTRRMEQIVGIKGNAELATPLDLFSDNMSSVVVTISTCPPGIPTVIIKSINVPSALG